MEDEIIPEANPWDDAPPNTVYYKKIYDDGHLGTHTYDPKYAYLNGFYENRLSADDVVMCEDDLQVYLKDRCPHKTEEQIQQEAINQRIAEIKLAVQNTLDLKAKEKDYDTAVSLASYVTSTDDEFHEQANRFIAWRDQCWRKCFEVIGLFNNGDIPMPTVGEVLRQLPTLDWE